MGGMTLTDIKELECPMYPKRIDFYSDKQYLEAIKQYKTDRSKWINQNKDRDPLVKVSKEKKRKKRQDRKVKDSEFKREQSDKYKQQYLGDKS